MSQRLVDDGPLVEAQVDPEGETLSARGQTFPGEAQLFLVNAGHSAHRPRKVHREAERIVRMDAPGKRKSPVERDTHGIGLGLPEGLAPSGTFLVI